MITKFKIGDTVYLRADPDQRKWVVIGLYLTLNETTYTLRNFDKTDTFYAFEISKDKTFH